MKTSADNTIVKVTRNGQITIPAKIRKQYEIKASNSLLVKVTPKGILFKPVKLLDMVGIDAGYGTAEEIKKMIDKLREEY